MKTLLAALSFFTRLPFWRLADIPKECYERVVPLWPAVGWLTGGLMCLVFYVSSLVLPLSVCIVLAMLSRVMLTGALHEDGFADFCDGFGGGTSRQRTLEIMKDSHIGTYGVLGLVIYYILMWNVQVELLSATMFPLVFIVADTTCKYLSSNIIYHLPYARKESEAKNKLVYSNASVGARVIGIILGLAPMVLLCTSDLLVCGVIALVVSALTCGVLFHTMWKRIQGYTGDCCGATFVISEAVYYVSFLIAYTLIWR